MSVTTHLFPLLDAETACARIFEVAARVEDEVVARGSGRSKKEAEQAAAAAALAAATERKA